MTNIPATMLKYARYFDLKFMMKMKGSLMLVCMLMISANIYSQARMSEEEREEAMERYQTFLDKLALDDEQKPKVEEINKEYFEGLANLRKTSGSRREKFNAFKQLSSTRDKKMKNILTKEQFVLYNENQEEQRENFRERRRRSR